VNEKKLYQPVLFSQALKAFRLLLSIKKFKAKSKNK
jgi:hypothetical protein